VVTCTAYILIISNFIVFVVHFCLVMLVAIDALEHTIVSRIHVTIGACIPFFSMFTGINGKILIVMIPCCVAPVRRVMTALTLFGELSRSVIRILGALILLFVTEKAIFWCIGVSFCMTIAAIGRNMCARERKLGLIMIKSCRFQTLCRMADSTIMIKIAGNMIGILDRIKINLMTRPAILGRSAVNIV